jgi:hypothetical protein
MRNSVRLGTNYLRSDEFNNFLMQFASNKRSQYNIVKKYIFMKNFQFAEFNASLPCSDVESEG